MGWYNVTLLSISAIIKIPATVKALSLYQKQISKGVKMNSLSMYLSVLTENALQPPSAVSAKLNKQNNVVWSICAWDRCFVEYLLCLQGAEWPQLPISSRCNITLLSSATRFSMLHTILAKLLCFVWIVPKMSVGIECK